MLRFTSSGPHNSRCTRVALPLPHGNPPHEWPPSRSPAGGSRASGRGPTAGRPCAHHCRRAYHCAVWRSSVPLPASGTCLHPSWSHFGSASHSGTKRKWRCLQADLICCGPSRQILYSVVSSRVLQRAQTREDPELTNGSKERTGQECVGAMSEFGDIDDSVSTEPEPEDRRPTYLKPA